jgi:hypothetical protein
MLPGTSIKVRVVMLQEDVAGSIPRAMWSLPPGDEQHIVIVLAGAMYAVSLADVHDIAHVPDMTPVPGAPIWVHGVCEVQDTVVIVLDLAELLGVGSWERSGDARLLVQRGDDPVAFAVQEASALRDVGPADHRGAEFDGTPDAGADEESLPVLDLASVLEIAENRFEEALSAWLERPRDVVAVGERRF